MVRTANIQKTIIAIILVLVMIATGLSIIDNSRDYKANTTLNESIGFISNPIFWIKNYNGCFESLKFQRVNYNEYLEGLNFEAEGSFKNISSTCDTSKQVVFFSYYYLLLHLKLLLFTVLITIISYINKKDGKKSLIKVSIR